MSTRQDMRFKAKKRGIIFLFFFIFIPCLLIYARSGNPPDGKTGAPGEGTCRDCHLGNNLNESGGTFSVSGFPSNYALNTEYSITINFSRTGATLFGFEAIVKETANRTIVGTFTAGTGMQVSSGGYIKHNSSGITGSGGSKSWTFIWKSPSSDVGEIQLFTAGNAANGNGATSGDFIYTTQSFPTVLTNINSRNNVTESFELLQNYPNPFNPATKINYRVGNQSRVELKIYNTLGEEIKTLVNDNLPAGLYKIQWDGTDNNGKNVSSGIYFCRYSDEKNFAQTIKMILAR